MDRYDALNAAAPGEAYRNGTPTEEGSYPNALGFDAVMTEIVNAITMLGGAPSNEAWDQLGEQIVAYVAAQIAAGITLPDDASATVKGIVKLATSALVIAGVDDLAAVTSAGLASLTATTARRGLAEFTTDTEADAMTDATRAVTASNLGYMFAHSYGVTGYERMPGGKIRQWGYVPSGTTGVQTITLPIAFTTEVYAVYTSRDGITNIDNDSAGGAKDGASLTTIKILRDVDGVNWEATGQ
ncbi:MAG: hypothetical protein GC184_14570 [Rhizobiales bacterium]|nr:hypothetical protein [Hyphomicrobiales bacterium]